MTMERFTERARQVVVLAAEEARGLMHSYIGSEHLLLGLIREEEGLAARCLRNLGVDLDAVRREVGRIVGVGTELIDGQLPVTPRARRVMDLALRESLSLGHTYVGTEHLLLGIVRENEGVASRILDVHGVQPDAVRNEIIRTLSGPRKRPPEPSVPDPWKALREIRNALGPVAGCHQIGCDGCKAEMDAALRIANEALA